MLAKRPTVIWVIILLSVVVGVKGILEVFTKLGMLVESTIDMNVGTVILALIATTLILAGIFSAFSNRGIPVLRFALYATAIFAPARFFISAAFLFPRDAWLSAASVVMVLGVALMGFVLYLAGRRVQEFERKISAQ